MPVPSRPDGGSADAVAAALAQAESELVQVAGTPPVVDIVLLGLGTDGHTASLVPNDPALDETTPLAVSALYQGRRRMTFTFPTIASAGRLVWLVAGAAKADALGSVIAGDRRVPAGRIRHPHSTIITDIGATAHEV